MVLLPFYLFVSPFFLFFISGRNLEDKGFIFFIMKYLNEHREGAVW